MFLRTRPTATPADLRLSYRICRLEHESDSAAKPETRGAERAFNLLAHPDLRSCYDALLQDPDAPALFPYGGFGQCVVSGELAEDGNTFFVRRLLSYLPDQRQRQFRAPLRRIDYLDGCALYRDSRRKAEVYIDPSLLPLGWDPTWNQWKHLVATKIGITATFVESGKYRPDERRMASGQVGDRSAQSLVCDGAVRRPEVSCRGSPLASALWRVL